MSQASDGSGNVVWQQFKRDRFALVSLWLLLPPFLIALYAPILASELPFVYFQNGEAVYPWVHGLFNPPTMVDYIFNMMMLASVPVILIMITARLIPVRWLRVPIELLIMTLVLSLFFHLNLFRPSNKFAAQTFVKMEYTAMKPVPNSSPKTPPPSSTKEPSKSAGSTDEKSKTKNDVSDVAKTRNEYQGLMTLPEAAYRYSTHLLHEYRPDYEWIPKVEDQWPQNWNGRGIYAFLPFGPTEISEFNDKPPGYVTDDSDQRDANDRFYHPIGTDNAGRDVLTIMIYGMRIALSVGFVAVSIYVAIGIIVGAIAGYFGGWIDMVLSRCIEVVMLFPSFFLILAVVAFMGPNIYIIMVVIGLTGWTSVARLVRGEFLKQRSLEYVTAAKALGASHRRVIFSHILPNSLSPVLVVVPFGVGAAIVTEAGLSLIGFGVKPPTPSWGYLLNQGQHNYSNWWLIVFPSLAIFFIVTLFNLIGAGLRDALDPRLRV